MKMLKVWTDIDPAVAERRLRGLRRRLSELDLALSGLHSLAKVRPDSFAVRLSAKSLSSMERSLRGELAEILKFRQAEQVSIALDGPEYCHHTAKLSDLGVIFTRMQKLFSSVAQSVSIGPTLRGPIRSEIWNSTSLRLQSTFASSFGMNLAVPSEYDLFGESVASKAFMQLFHLLNSDPESAEFIRLSGEVGRRSLVHYRHLVNHLRLNQATLQMGWQDFAGTRYEWKLTTDRAAKVISAIDNIAETRSESRERQGRLVGASLLRNRFEILTDDGFVLEGKFITGLLENIADAFGKHVKIQLDETEIFDRASDETKVFYTLKHVEEL